VNVSSGQSDTITIVFEKNCKSYKPKKIDFYFKFKNEIIKPVKIAHNKFVLIDHRFDTNYVDAYFKGNGKTFEFGFL
jgi:hypothetical protein